MRERRHLHPRESVTTVDHLVDASSHVRVVFLAITTFVTRVNSYILNIIVYIFYYILYPVAAPAYFVYHTQKMCTPTILSLNDFFFEN